MFKKIALTVFSMLLLCAVNPTNSMFNDKDSVKKTAALFAHDHPILTAGFFNTLVFSCTGLLRSKPIKRFGLFVSSTAIGAFFSQHLGHNYLHSRYIPHKPKVNLPLCSKTCNNWGAAEGINQFVYGFWKNHLNK